MILTRTPFRISFFGGGTDFPSFYREHGATVLSVTINKYCYIMTRELPPFFDYKYRIRYTNREETATIAEIKHPVVRAVLEQMNLPYGIEMVHTSDIPAMSGIGSSSAFTVGFLQGIQALTGRIASKRQLADRAIDIEQNRLGENVGSQDQIAVAFGGLNRIDFQVGGGYAVTPITIPRARIAALEQRCLLFFTGFTRYSSDIQKEQIANLKDNTARLLAMKALTGEAFDLLNSDAPLCEFGTLLDRTWQLKCKLGSQVSNSLIDQAYAAARRAGASGGKILGAGGGGFLLVFVEPEFREKVCAALSPMLRVPFHFESAGSQVTMYSQLSYSEELEE